MSAPQFTPGPWRAAPAEFCSAWQVVSKSGILVTELPLGGNDDDAMIPHDARLIAAAPEMLDALEVMTSFAAQTIEKLGLVDTNGIVAASREIMARARGETA